MKKSNQDIITETINAFVKESNGRLSGRPIGDWRATSSKLNWEPSEKFAHPEGTQVKVSHKGQMVSGKVVRYDKGAGAESSFYVVDVGEYESLKVPSHKVEKLSESNMTEEVDTGQVRSAQDDKDAARERKNKAPEQITFHVKHEKSGKIVSSHGNRRDAESALNKHGFEGHKIVKESHLAESENAEVIAKKGKHTLSRITRKDGTGYYKLDDQWRADYPLYHDHNDTVAFDNPEYFPKPVVSWASDVVKKHAKTKK